ncbi:hypothetical protein DERP_004376 [Dermatophagoides pteronyssinus]|uniref:Uncharacterized protein n=1 Tax=Dermatophagoides pteronyssinus TaxID=6956 RepID=A0ABQ8JNL0_DERPT|nr:hypothetical protein DERP_004376 [Dermatophagoides pteronyssinus]
MKNQEEESNRSIQEKKQLPSSSSNVPRDFSHLTIIIIYPAEKKPTKSADGPKRILEKKSMVLN